MTPDEKFSFIESLVSLNLKDKQLDVKEALRRGLS